MELQIQDLVSSIRKEGIDAANSESERIIADAKAKAETIVADAKAEAKSTKELSEKEIEAKLDAYLEAYKASNQVLVDWYPKFKKVLPIRKVAKLYQAEEAFQMRMINNLRKHPGPSYPKKDS